MSTTQTSTENATPQPERDRRPEARGHRHPVSDVDRAKHFYESLGWKLDADFWIGKNFRAVQLTPPGSPCSIHLSTTAAPGSAQGMFLVVSDLEAARSALIAHGAR
jgi:predicted enzyme related to lactoylglutathione lyase